jgi:membrane protease YdiL (CAAX protease family)
MALFGPLLIARLGERVESGRARLPQRLLAQAALVVMALLVLWLARSAEGLTWPALGLKQPNIRSFLLGAALAGFFVFVFGPSVLWSLSRLRLTAFEQGLSKLQGLPVWYLLLAVLVGGSVEELLYRAYAFERLAFATGSIWLAAAIPLFIFALAHVPMWGWPAAFTTLFSGGILTAWYWWHRDLTANIIAHCATDFMGIVVPSAIQNYRAAIRK